MFTGIIENQGRVESVHAGSLSVSAPSRLIRSLKIGGSVAVNGACLTVVKKTAQKLFFDLLGETKKRTTLASLVAGESVHLELPLRFGDPVGGHFVSGHVEAVGEVLEIVQNGREKSFLIRFPKKLSPRIYEKGSVALDGVSLTLGKVKTGTFWVHVIPHTLKNTHLKNYKVGSKVNLETERDFGKL